MPGIQKKSFMHSLLRPLAGAYSLCICLCMLSTAALAQAPKADSADKIRINIINTQDGFYFKTDSGEFRKFIGDVILTQGTDTLYCDSVIQNSTTKNFEAFSNVRIVQQGGTEGTSDYLRYTADKKLAYMQGNVSLTDGKNKLWSEDLTYDLGTKTGVYTKGGTLQSDSTTVSSLAGVYNVKSKEARFTGNVLVTDPKYKVKSKDLGYNTETKVETFYDQSVVTSDSGRSILMTRKGTYDSKNVVAHFTGPSSIWNDGQYIEADSMHYNKLTGYGFAIGHVISIDTTQHATIYCGRADYFRKQRVLWAIIKPVMELANGKDTFYMRADTLYSAPMVKIASRYPAFKMPVDDTATGVYTATDSARLNLKAKTDITRGTALSDTATKSTGTLNAQPNMHKGRRPKPVADTGTVIMSKALPDTIMQNDMATVDTLPTKDSASVKSRKQRKSKDTTAEKSVAAVMKKAFTDTIWMVPATKFRIADYLKDTAAKSVAVQKPKGKARKDIKLSAADTAEADTTAPIYFTGYHHVLIFSDSMQAKCDSVVYTRSDSIVRMIYAPIAWSRGSQITGDTILMQLDSSSIRSMYVPNNSFVASQSGPDQAQIWDQIQGKTLTAFFKGNTVSKMIVTPDAESIYYSKDDGGAYLGVNEASSELMRVFFGDQKINKIKFEKDVKQTMTPLEQADLPNTRLSRFKWLIDQRPKNKEELFQ